MTTNSHDHDAQVDSLMKGELPRHSDVEPEIVKSVIKLDGRSMVWAHVRATGVRTVNVLLEGSRFAGALDRSLDQVASAEPLIG